MNSRFGILRIGLGHPWYLGYGEHGWGAWLPDGVKQLIVMLWNRAICACRGHVPYVNKDKSEHIPCLHCGLGR